MIKIHLTELKEKQNILKKLIVEHSNFSENFLNNEKEKKLKYFDKNYFYDINFEGNKSFSNSVFKEMLENLNKEFSKNQKFEFKSGFIEINPTENVLMILNNELEFKNNNSVTIQNLQLNFPLMDFEINYQKFYSITKINFILYACDQSKNIESFLYNFYENIFKTSINIRLIIVSCQKNVLSMNQAILKLNITDNDMIKIFEYQGSYSKLDFLKQGSKLVNTNEILFFFDNYYLFEKELITRIRFHTRINSRAYMPIFFQKIKSNNSISFTNESEWHFITCFLISIFKQDLDQNILDKLTFHKREEEEKADFNRILKSENIYIFKTYDPSIISIF